MRALLDGAGLAYEVDPTLVRGLDYYTRTVFEFTSDALGAQSGVGGGGRYDGLVEQLGGPADARRSAGRPGSSGCCSAAEHAEPREPLVEPVFVASRASRRARDRLPARCTRRARRAWRRRWS